MYHYLIYVYRNAMIYDNFQMYEYNINNIPLLCNEMIGARKIAIFGLHVLFILSKLFMISKSH